jgi:cardiolipin synthase A/B
MRISSTKKLSHSTKYTYFENQSALFKSMIDDINNAKKYIYLETYRFGDGLVGRKFNDALTKKALEGVEIKLLIDHWGTLVNDEFFNDFTKSRGEIRFFRRFKVTFNFVGDNNKRDHRKLLVIDDKITYLGSSNISENTLLWREFNVKMEGNITGIFKEIFMDTYRVHDKLFHSVRPHISSIHYGNLEIVRDMPSIKYRRVRSKLKEQIKKAKKSIVLETPYFVPDFRFMGHLIKAAKRGVEVTLIIPKRGDVPVVDVMSGSFLGYLHRQGIKIKYYSERFNHSKIALFDDVYFSFGSANLDHRSFSYQYELNLFGSDEKLTELVRKHIKDTLRGCKDFDYEKWKKRPLFQKFLEILYIPARTFM